MDQVEAGARDWNMARLCHRPPAGALRRAARLSPRSPGLERTGHAAPLASRLRHVASWFCWLARPRTRICGVHLSP